jgi:hypothetical protein
MAYRIPCVCTDREGVCTDREGSVPRVRRRDRESGASSASPASRDREGVPADHRISGEPIARRRGVLGNAAKLGFRRVSTLRDDDSDRVI